MLGVSRIHFKQNTVNTDTNTSTTKTVDSTPVKDSLELSTTKPAVKSQKNKLTPEQKRERNINLLKLVGCVAFLAWACYHLSKIKLSPEEEFILYDSLTDF